MLNQARKGAAALSTNVSFVVGDAAALPFSDHVFDTVVSSLSGCTFTEPLIAIQEMARLCRADGKILLLEHGRSDREWLGRFQDRNVEKIAKPLGCHWNCEALELVKQAGLKVVRAQRTFFGIFHEIEATSV